ncbi:cytochrome P450 [Mycena rosella]|uniref:Cytochrome P450 n=1 Tax=Mycena rosella TaxID=1033263 RepID=A0AAD7CWV6_MYCRO|nr:cytochrome P450 [Mycena rosella]
MNSRFGISVAAALTSYVLFKLAKLLYEDLSDPLRDLPGPTGANLVLGHWKQINNDSTLTGKWREEFGANFQYRSPFNRTPDTIKHLLENVIRVKRRLLRDFWTRQIVENSGSSRIDVLVWLRKMTLDIIGQAGFNYQFHAMEPKGQRDELVQVLDNLFHSGKVPATFLTVVGRLVTSLGKMMNEGRRKMDSIGRRLLADSKASLKADGGSVSGTERDLLSIMVKANMTSDIPDHQRLSDADVIAQFPTFFIAGHETTSIATAWALHALSINSAMQSKLRDELLSVSTDNPTMDELYSARLPYLDKVVKETMRLYNPVAFTFRMAMKDDALPLNTPFLDAKGKLRTSIPIRKGTMIQIPMVGVHLDNGIWGEDADEFRQVPIPDRWDNIPQAASSIPSIWGNLLSFLAGPHNCIGFRFAIIEIKAILFTLIRAFEFEPGVPEGGIISSATPIQRPKVRTEPRNGGQLPLIVRPSRTVRQLELVSYKQTLQYYSLAPRVW